MCVCAFLCFGDACLRLMLFLLTRTWRAVFACSDEPSPSYAPTHARSSFFFVRSLSRASHLFRLMWCGDLWTCVRCQNSCYSSPTIVSLFCSVKTHHPSQCSTARLWHLRHSMFLNRVHCVRRCVAQRNCIKMCKLFGRRFSYRIFGKLLDNGSFCQNTTNIRCEDK